MKYPPRSKKWSAAKSMPPLRHSIPGQEFDIRDSEVIKWLIQQPDILHAVFDHVKNQDIFFNPDTGTWQGKDYAT